MAHIDNSRSSSRRRPRSSSKKPARRAGSARSRSEPLRRGAHISKKAASPKRRSPQQERARETAEAIVTAAELILVEIGYAHASTNVIARRAGVSVGSLYQYFPNKEAVYRAVVARHRERVHPLISNMLVQLAEPSTDLVETTLTLLRRMVEVNGENPRLMASIDCELGWLEHEYNPSSDLLGAIEDILRSKVPGRGREVEVLAHLMVMTVSVLARWLVHGKPANLDSERFMAAMGRMLHGLLDPEAASEKRRVKPTRGRSR